MIALGGKGGISPVAVSRSGDLGAVAVGIDSELYVWRG